MKILKKIFIMLLMFAVSFQTLFSITTAKENDNVNEKDYNVSSTESKNDGKSENLSKEEVNEDENDNVEEFSESFDAKDKDGVLMVTLSGDQLEGSPIKLEDGGVSSKAQYRAAFNLHIEVTYPTGYEKKLEVELPYGMCFATDFSGEENKQSSWFLQELNKEILPYQQNSDEKQPTKFELNNNSLRNGTLTYEFKETIESINFDLKVYTIYSDYRSGLITNLHNVKDAVKVLQSYKLPDGTIKQNIRKIDNLEFTGYKGKVEAQTNYYYRYLNDNNNLPVALGGDSGSVVAYAATDPTREWNSYRLLEDYSVYFIVPDGVVYKGLYDENFWLGKGFENPEIKQAGETYVTSAGENKIVPEGKLLYKFSSKGPVITATNYNYSRTRIIPIWSFANKDKFPIGTVVEIKMADVGIKYSDQGEKQEYLPCDVTKLPSVKYEIVDQVEQTFVETKYEKDNQGKIDRAGYISDTIINLGAPGQEFKQEYLLGYFIAGNRGTADSKPKRITLEYDVNKTGLIGVTGQFIPRNKDVIGLEDTNISNFKYKLWNSKTNKETDWINWDFSKEIPEELTITDVSKDANDYIKAISYEIDTIPMQKYLGKNGNNASKSFNFYGKSLTNKVVTVKPNPVPQGSNDQFLSTIKMENIDGSDSLLGRTFTGTSGKVVMPKVHKSWGIEGDSSIIAGETKRLTFDVLGAGSDGIAGVVNKIWVISPNGSKIDNWKISKQFVYKGYRADYYDEKGNGWVLDDITSLVDFREISAPDNLKEKFPKARLYEFDFRNIPESNKDDYFRARIMGPQTITIKRADGLRPASWGAYWFCNGDIVLEGDYHSSLDEKPLAKEPGITWVEMKSDTNVKNEDGTSKEVIYPSNYVEDKYDLSDSGSKLVFNNRLTVYQQNKIVVKAALKKFMQTDKSYITYDFDDETSVVGLEALKHNQTVNYKINIKNLTGYQIKEVSAYFPIPKKGDNWGTSINPKGQFNFNMNLEGSLKNRIPDDYKVYYVQNAKPIENNLEWKNYNWVEDKDTRLWGKDDWSKVNFVKIEKVNPLEGGANDEMILDILADSNALLKELNVWKAGFRYNFGDSIGWSYSEAVAASILDGSISGLVWHDLSHDGKIDNHEQKLSDVIVRLYSKYENGNRRNLLSETRTNLEGKYEFNNLWTNKTYEVEVEIPDNYNNFTVKGNELDNDFEKNEKNDEKFGVVDAEVNEKNRNIEKNAGIIKSEDKYKDISVIKKWNSLTAHETAYFVLEKKVDGEWLPLYDGAIHELKYDIKDSKSIPTIIKVERDDNGDYRVVETDDQGNKKIDKIIIGKEKYSIEVTGNQNDGFVIKNTELYEKPHKPEKEYLKICVNKVWEGTKQKETYFVIEKKLDGKEWQRVNEVPYKIVTGKTKVVFLEKEGIAEYQVYESNRYGIKADSEIKIGNSIYEVSIDGDIDSGFTITNKEKVNKPGKPNITVDKKLPSTGDKTIINNMSIVCFALGLWLLLINVIKIKIKKYFKGNCYK